jgi:hypothetical protein
MEAHQLGLTRAETHCGCFTGTVEHFVFGNDTSLSARTDAVFCAQIVNESL